MATQTDSETQSPGVLMRDRLVRRVGEFAAGGFVLAIGGLLVWILTTQVNGRLLASPLIAGRFFEAFLLVVRIVVISSVLSVTAGVFVGLGRISTSPITGRIATGYIEFFRGTPLCVALFVIAFAGP